MRKKIDCFLIFNLVILLSLVFSTPTLADKLKVGLLLPLSGNFAALGLDNKQGVEVANKLYGLDKNIEFFYADSKADAVTSVSEFRKLIEVDKIAIAFAMRGPVGMAVNPISKNLKFPLLGAVGNIEFARSNEYAFQTWPSSVQEGEFLARTFSERAKKKIALLNLEDDWPQSVSKALKENLERYSLELVLEQNFTSSENDFRSTIAKLRVKNPDLVFVNIGISQIGPFIKQFKEQGLKSELFSNFWAAKKEVIEAAGKEYISDVSYLEMDLNMPKFKEQVYKSFAIKPSAAMFASYVSMTLLHQALNFLKNEAADPNDLYHALLSQSVVETVDGPLQVKDRCLQFPLAIRLIKDNF